MDPLVFDVRGADQTKRDAGGIRAFIFLYGNYDNGRIDRRCESVAVDLDEVTQIEAIVLSRLR